QRTQNGTLYYNEFQTHFWEKVDDEFDRILDNNTSNTNIPDLQPPPYADATNTQQVNEDNEDNAPTSTENNPDNDNGTNNEINTTGNSDNM
ncbi:2240_t:CDS:2, partial [Entrophospora sp. SA101]